MLTDFHTVWKQMETKAWNSEKDVFKNQKHNNRVSKVVATVYGICAL